MDRDDFLTLHGLIPEMLAGRVQPAHVLVPARRTFASWAGAARLPLHAYADALAARAHVLGTLEMAEGEPAPAEPAR